MFDVTIILTILINCVFLALDDPVDELEYVFTAIYTLEVVIKVSQCDFKGVRLRISEPLTFNPVAGS